MTAVSSGAMRRRIARHGDAETAYERVRVFAVRL